MQWYKAADRLNRLFKIMFLPAWLVIAATSCNKSNSDGYRAGIITGNWVVNGRTFNFRFDDAKFSKDSLSYNETSSAAVGIYHAVGAGLHRLTLTSGTETLVNNVFSFRPAANYSILLFDTLQNQSLKMLMLEDQVQPVDTLVKARFIQLIPGSDSVTMLFARNTTTFFSTEAYLGKNSSSVSGAFPLALPPGSYSLAIARNNVILPSRVNLSLEAGKVYSFISKGIAGGTGVYEPGIQVIQHN